MIRVEAIQFNHRLDVAAGTALNIRRNADSIVELPEWKAGRSVDPVDSPAAYAIDANQNSPISILASFRRSNPTILSAEVRAVQAQTQRPLGLPFYLLHPQLIWPGNYFFSGWPEFFASLQYSAYYRWWQSQFEAPLPNVLGVVKPKRVVFKPDGSSVLERFELANTSLSTRGVGVEDVSWRWQFRLNRHSAWQDMHVTRHRIYSVLSTPTAPWLQQPLAENTQLPWTDVLELACRWAFRATNTIEAAKAVTEVVHGMGGGLLEYGCPIGALSMYSSLFGLDAFDCTAFVERMNLGPGNGPYVNCTDCASIVTTFANSLGCNLWESRMGQYSPAFNTNPVNVIGSKVFESPCGTGLGFSYHEVAWTGDCTATDNVYDACLKVLLDTASGSLLPAARLPADMRFGNPGDGQYRDLLAAPDSRAVCSPRPTERKRRIVV